MCQWHLENIKDLIAQSVILYWCVYCKSLFFAVFSHTNTDMTEQKHEASEQEHRKGIGRTENCIV